MEAEKPVQQAFGSPGGKSYLAPKIAGMIPPHETYVEPFAGGAAVFFKKEPSAQEVLSDKDKGIAFAFRFLRDMTEVQFKRLQGMNWKATEANFKRVKNLQPKDAVERFYRFYYLKKASFGYGDNAFNHNKDGQNISIDHLGRVRDRLKRTTVHENDAIALIDKYDKPNTFFYLDPPYPKRAFIGQSFKDWTDEDLKKLISKLQNIKGKFALSIGTEHAKFMPKNWHIHRVKVWRRIPSGDAEFNQSYQYEIIVTNYAPQKAKSMLRRFMPSPKRVLGKRLRRRRNGNRHLQRSASSVN